MPQRLDRIHDRAGVLRPRGRRVFEEAGQIFPVPLARVIGQLAPNVAQHCTRGLAARLVLPEVLHNRRSRAQARVPGAQRRQGRCAGEVLLRIGRVGGSATFHECQFKRLT